MSDLLVTAHTPALRSGRALRTYGLARALAATGDGLDLLYVRFEGGEPDAAFASIAGVSMHAVVPSRGVRRALAYARARARGVPAALARGVSPELAAAAERLAHAAGRGRVIADGPVVAAALASLARKRPVIYNAHNFESGFRHELEGGSGDREQLARFERRTLEDAAESWMVSEADLAAATALAPDARLRYVPNVVDVNAIAPVSADAASRRIAFVANYAYAPNRDAVALLVEEVMPRVWRELPDARLRLVGGGLERKPSEDPRVETPGFVPDVRDAYTGAACVVVPLRVGGGTPLKLIEALAYGLPVVATPRAVAGLAVHDGVHCLVADGPDALAAALVRILREGGEKLGRAGRELAAERYSIEALTRLLAA